MCVSEPPDVWRTTSTKPSARRSSRLDRVGEAAAVFRAHGESGRRLDRDRVVLAAIEFRRLGELDQGAVDDRADEALGAGGLEELAEFAFAAADEWGEDLEAGALGPSEDCVGDLARALPLDGSAQLAQCGVPARA